MPRDPSPHAGREPPGHREGAPTIAAHAAADIIDALGGEQLPIRSAQVYAGASPAVQVDGPLLGSSAIEVLREAGRRLSR